ncbi:hypothetical protein ACFYOV_04875 [Streptomyces sp. NPDC005931]|uniref:hypothetical protein n=1 Tax=Streptomyces sp. NPDC005931 TaxID=3364737 RepID=UPI003686B968
MPQSDDERLVDPAARSERRDDGSARSPAPGRPARPRESRRTGARWALATGVALIIAGVVLADGLLMATGLVLSGIALQLCDPDPPGAPREPRRPRT